MPRSGGLRAIAYNEAERVIETISDLDFTDAEAAKFILWVIADLGTYAKGKNRGTPRQAVESK